MLELLIIYLIAGIPGTLLYAYIEYKMYFTVEGHPSFWQGLIKDFSLLDTVIIYLGWLYFLITTIFTFIAWKINGM